jgi:TatD DNase family protein
MTVIDSHCHLDGPKFAADRDETIARARAAGVEAMLAIGSGDGPPDLEAAIRLADRYPFIRATVGVHPHDASKATPETFDRLRGLAAHPQVAAIGEIGLDYHYDFSPRDVQRSVFSAQLSLAAQVSLPIVVHTREAWDDTLALLRQHWNGPGVLHCFTGAPEQARQALDLGFPKPSPPANPPASRPSTASSSRPTAPISPPSPTAASATSRPLYLKP